MYVCIFSFDSSSNSVQIVADIYYNFTTSITDGILKRNIETKSSSFSAVSIKGMHRFPHAVRYPFCNNNKQLGLGSWASPVHF